MERHHKGEMAELTMQFDWSVNSVGSRESWPVSLTTLVNLLLGSSSPMLLFWGADLIVFYNDAFRGSLGNDGKHPSSLGQPAEKVWAEVWDTIGPVVQGVLKGGPSVNFEDVLLPIYRHGKLDRAYWSYSYIGVTNDAGKVSGVLVTCTETTDKVDSLSKLKDTNDRLTFTIDASELATWELNPDTHAFTANRRLREWFGLPLDEEILYNVAVDAVPEPDRSLVASAILRALDFSSGGTYDVEHRLITPGTGETRIVHARGLTIFDEHQKPLRFNGTIQDVTAERLAQQSLSESEERFQNLVREATVGIVVLMGEDMNVSIVNEGYARLTGWKIEQLKGQKLFDIIPDAEAYFRPLINGVLNSGDPLFLYDTPYTVLSAEGQTIHGYLNVVYQPYREADGTITGVLVLCQDVTEQVVAKQRLEATEASLRQAVDLANLGTWSVDVTTTFTSMSPRLINWFGVKGEGADAETLIGCIRQDEREMVSKALFSTLEPGSDGIYNVEYTVINAVTGQERILHVLGQSFFDNEGKALRISGIARDITSERAIKITLEQQVQERTEQLAAVVEELRATNEELEGSNNRLAHSNEELAQFAYIASHDLQEPLRKISTFSQMLEKDLGNNLSTPATNYLSKIRTSSLRMTTLINDVLHYSRLGRDNENFTPVDLNEILKNVISDFDLAIEQKNAKVNADPLPVIDAIPLQMSQLFRNLVSNALKFTREGTDPAITIKTEILSQQESAGLGLMMPGGYAKISFTDNGIGIAPEYAEKIFHIFQRLHAKSAYEGTGIGLAICRKIALHHHGTIFAEGMPGTGTTFTVILPVNHA